MHDTIETLASFLRHHVQHNGAEKPLGGVGVFHCRSVQQLREVPLHQACIVFVVSGVKHIQVNTRRFSCSAGRLTLFAAGTHAQIENIPATDGDYLASAQIEVIYALITGRGCLQSWVVSFCKHCGRRLPSIQMPIRMPVKWDKIGACHAVATITQKVSFLRKIKVFSKDSGCEQGHKIG